MGIQEDIAFLEQNIAELIIKYEQYFLGIEKRAPEKLFTDIELFIRRYNPSLIFNTMHKFRFNILVAKFNSYKQYWFRINRLIEEGKYSRDRFKMARHLAEGSLRPPAEPKVQSPENHLDLIYQNYLDARRSCNLPVDNITRETMFSVINKQREALINRHQCSDIEFRVVIEDGAPKLKARPAKKPLKS